MKYLALLVLVLLGVAAALAPVPDDPMPGAVPGREIPPISICPLLQGAGGSTDIAILSSINGAGRVSAFAAGSESGSVEFRTGAAGAVVVPAADTGARGEAGGLVEMPSDTTVSGVITRGASSMAAESCADMPTGQAFLAGGATSGGARFELQLLNPYAGEAVVDLTVSTEAGLESDEKFDSVIVPPLSSITLDFNEIIPEREVIAVELQTLRGSVLAVGRQTVDGETALWNAVEPAQDWWLPVPSGAARKELSIATPSSTDIEFQIDLYGSDGLTEAFLTGVIPARGRAAIDLAAISEEAFGVRVVATGPVVSTLWIDSSTGLAATTAGVVDAPVWLLPGAHGPAGGAGQIVVLNTGIEDVTVTIRSLTDQAITRDLPLSSERVLVVDMVAALGYRLEATGPVVALWTASVEGVGSAALGVPVQDG